MSGSLLRWGLILVCLGGLVLVPGEPQAGQPSHFYAIGAADQRRASALYKVDTATKNVLASFQFSKEILTDFALGRDGAVLFATDAEEVFVFDAGSLSLRDHFSVTSKNFPWGGSLFVPPKSRLLYLGRLGGSNPHEIAIADPTSRKVVKILELESMITGGFVYDLRRDRLYVTGAPPAMLDPQAQRVIGYIKLPSDPTIFWILFMPGERRLLVYASVYDPGRGGSQSVLHVYDPDRARVVRQATLPDLRFLRDPALSQDGSRLFAITSPGGDSGTAIVVDTQTLTILHTVTFPEPVGGFFPAPDGRGMWLTSKSGVLRLDDQTGQVLHPIQLPFQLGKLITPP